MATNAKTTNGQTAQRPAGSTASQSRRSIESAVDVPVGTALTVKDRVDGLTRPWRSVDSATSEVKSLRKRFDRELSRVERRGGTARRKLTRRANKTRNRVEREVTQRRRRAEDSLRTNRRRAEDRFREARTRVGERVPSL
ncbi:MAG: hypothetical protein ACRDL1_10460 [Solirubrobacterales bacterium]